MSPERRGSVRVIGGRWRRRRLPVADRPGLRPTPDRVRETLFNWLAADIPGARCLDLFAGTGALGLEAASRGAARVVLVERDPEVALTLRRNVEALGAETVEVVERDARRWIEEATGTFDVVFLDPPFGEVDPVAVWGRLIERGLLASGASVFLEGGPGAADPAPPAGWRMVRCGRAGKVRYHLAAPE